MTMRPRALRLFLMRWLLWLAVCGPASAAPMAVDAIAVDPAAERIDLSERMFLLRDPQRHLALTDVLAMSEAFQPTTRQDLVTSFNPAVFWLRLSVQASGDWPLTRWLAVGTAKTPRVTLYLREGDTWQTLNSGRAIPVRARPLETIDPVFPLSLTPGQPRELLLRVDSRGATDMATALWEPQAYRHDVSKKQMSLTAILGGLLVSGALALLVFAVLREAQYLWLGLFLCAIAGLEATRTNFLSTYLWPAALAQPVQVLSLFAVISIFGLSKVAAHALELSQRLPTADRLLLVLRWSGVAGALLSLADYGHGVRLLSIIATFQNIATLTLCTLVWARGHATARFFLFAFSLALLTETTRQLANLGVLPWIAAMEFSTFLFLLASPFILFGMIEQTRRLSLQLHVAEQLRQAKTAFVARVSHELRSPLSTLLGFNRMLARRSDNLSVAEGTAEIEKNALRLLQLIEELLDEARAAAGKLTVSPTPLRLPPWLDEIAGAAQLAAEAKGNRFSLEVSGTPQLTVLTDGVRLRQVIDNLLANANRHTRGGTLRLQCRVTDGADAVTLDFAVVDDGDGIASHRLAAIFEPFERGSTAADASGLGLGLPICRELVRQMDGDITVSSALGKGSRFAFTLRCPRVASDETPSVRSSAAPKVGAGGTAIDAMQWQALARLADEGDVSGITDWLDACRAAHPEQTAELERVAHALRKLDLAALQRLGAGFVASVAPQALTDDGSVRAPVASDQ